MYHTDTFHLPGDVSPRSCEDARLFRSDEPGSGANGLLFDPFAMAADQVYEALVGLAFRHALFDDLLPTYRLTRPGEPPT